MKAIDIITTVSATILASVNLDSEKDTDYETDIWDFDFEKYSEPVEDCRRNKIIDTIQVSLILVPVFTFIAMLFINFYDYEVVILTVVPFVIAFLLEKLKDKAAQEAYEEYETWLEQKLEFEEQMDDFE